MISDQEMTIQAKSDDERKLDEELASLRRTICAHPQEAGERFEKWLLTITIQQGKDKKLPYLKLHTFKDFSFPKGAVFNNKSFGGFSLEGAIFEDAELKHSKLNHCNLTEASFRSDCNLQSADFRAAICTGMHVTDSDCRNAKFNKATLDGCRFQGGDIRGAVFDESSLHGAVLRPALVDSDTSFKGLDSVYSMSMTRLALESLGPQRGGLSVSQISEMHIQHDLDILKQSFSGFHTALHLLSLAIFVLPYAWFLCSKWTTARFDFAGEQTASLWLAFCRFIYSGGQNIRAFEFAWPFVPFLVAFAYNAFRAMWLWKTKKLEHREVISSVPSPFRFDQTVGPKLLKLVGTRNVIRIVRVPIVGFLYECLDFVQSGLRWRTVWTFTRFLEFIYFGCVVANAFHFLSMRVSV